MTRWVKIAAVVLFFGYLVLQLISFSLQGQQKLGFVAKLVVGVVSPIQNLTNQTVNYFGEWTRHYIFLTQVSRQNEILKKEKEVLHAKAIHFREIESENQRLRSLLELGEQKKLKLLGAERVAFSVSPFEKTIRIQRGQKNGVAVGMAVIHPQGVVGQILETFPHFSDVMLLSDPNSAIDVVDERSRVRAILRGINQDTLRFEYVPKTEDIQIGDTLVSSGLDGVYPQSILVGVVTKVEREEKDLFLTGTVRPSVSFLRLEEMAIVLNKP